MATVAKQITRKSEVKRRNWWKVAFFVLLILFEFTREIAVLNIAEKATPNAFKDVSAFGDYVTATGTWLRSDGGSPIVPGTVKIECRRNTGECIEVTTSANEKWFFAPVIDTFPATFTETTVSYVNDNPNCARYAVSIDTKTERVIATRDRKDNPKNEFCKGLEKRIAMELGNSWDRPAEDPAKNHFVPLLQLVKSFLDLFDETN